jgi:hypothetical protein
MRTPFALALFLALMLALALATLSRAHAAELLTTRVGLSRARPARAVSALARGVACD